MHPTDHIAAPCRDEPNSGVSQVHRCTPQTTLRHASSGPGGEAPTRARAGVSPCAAPPSASRSGQGDLDLEEVRQGLDHRLLVPVEVDPEHPEFASYLDVAG